MQNRCLFVFFMIRFTLSNARFGPVVYTNVGLIRGLPAEDGNYSMFMGIPYGKVDERNPFGAALPHPHFEGIYEAYDDSAVCPQLVKLNIATGTLDCLHLNVFVPNTVYNLPVLIWIHGGGFITGSFDKNVYGPRFLMRQQIILVTINFRLGVYGFMCADAPEVPGNQGLKDQYLAIKWVYDNIEAFGGNRNKITIMGVSSGSKSIDLHLLSDRPYLFNSVILQSGFVTQNDVYASDRLAPLKIAEYLGFLTDDFNSAITYLAGKDPQSVVVASSNLNLTFKVCVEKKFDKVEPFVSKHPKNSNLSKAKNISILAGTNSHESLISYKDKTMFVNTNLFKDTLKGSFDFNHQEMPDIMRQFYIGDDQIGEESLWEQIDFLSDNSYNYPAKRSLERYNNGRQDIYQYTFSYSGGRNIMKRKYNILAAGAAHGDELGYIFHQKSVTEAPSYEDQLIIDRMTTLWANFVKYGNPTPEQSDLLPIIWLPKTKTASYYMDINSELKFGTRPFRQRMAFWELFYKTNEKYLKKNVI